MRIHSIANISFGYNKELNEKVNNKLKYAKGNKELAKTLLDMNNLCNSTEDRLREAEKDKKQNLVEMYSSLFIPLKPIVADQLEYRFPLLNYRKTELEGYKNELESRKINDEYHWLREISEELELDEEFSDFKDIDSTPLSDNQNMVSSDKTAATPLIKTSAKEPGANYVEKFEPNEYSPKGFSSLGGMNQVKDVLYDKLIYPIKNPEMAKLDELEYGKKASRGEMFYGPPGCGKTSVMEALAMESGLPMYKLKISKAGSEYINKSSSNVQKAFNYVANIAAETGKPVLFVMDEMESMTRKRRGSENGAEDDKLVSTLLQIIEDARGKNVIILGATNCYNILDDAIKSRFEDKIYIGLPDDDTRRAVLKLLLNKRTKGRDLAANDQELTKVVNLTRGFSNRDLTILTDKASLIARNDNRRNITADDFIIPVKENVNMKVKEDIYKDNQTRPTIGFSRQ